MSSFNFVHVFSFNIKLFYLSNTVLSIVFDMFNPVLHAAPLLYILLVHGLILVNEEILIKNVADKKYDCW